MSSLRREGAAEVRILVTGMTTSQVGRQGQLGILNSGELYVKALREAGHTVDHRPPVVDDPDLASYDAVLCGLAPTINFTAGHAWPAMWTIGNARRLGVRLGTFVDDWRLFDLVPKFLYLTRNADKLLKPVLENRRGADWLRERPHELQVVARAFTDGRPWPPCLACAFTWGSATDPRWQRFVPSRQLTLVDPSAYVEPFPLEAKAPEDRERVWVNAALENPRELEKLNLPARFRGWPVEHFGGRNAGQPRVQESEVVARYHQVWGVVSLPHNRVSGLGWWRNRFVFAAQAGAVLSAWPEELASLNLPSNGYLQSPYTYEPSFLERCDADDLAEVALAQRTVLESWSPSREEVREQLDSFVRNLV